MKKAIFFVLLIGLLMSSVLVFIGCGASLSCKSGCGKPAGGCSLYCTGADSSSSKDSKPCDQVCK